VKASDAHGVSLKGKFLEVDVLEAGQRYMYGKICADYIPLLHKYPHEKNLIELKRELDAKNTKIYNYIAAILVALVVLAFAVGTKLIMVGK